MINNRVAFMSALAFAILSLFLVGTTEASLNNGDYEPSDQTRLDPSDGMSFSVVLDANNDAKFLNLDLFWYFVMSFFHSPEFNGKEYFSDVKNLDPITEW